MPYIAPPFTPTVTISGTDLIRNTDEKLQTIANDVGDYLEAQSQAMYTDLDGQMTVIENDYNTVLKPEIEQKMDDLLSVNPDGTYYTKSAIDTLVASKVTKVTSTDNAIARFDGTTGAIQNSGVVIGDSGNVGIGVTPTTQLEVAIADGASTQGIRIKNLDASMAAEQTVGALEVYSSDPSGAGVGVKGSIRVKSNDSVGSAYDMVFTTSNATSNDVERLRINSSGNLGIGVTPSAWNASSKAIEFPSGALENFSTTGFNITQNLYRNNSSQWIYKTSNYASMFGQSNGKISFYTAPSGTVGSVATLTASLTIPETGGIQLPNTNITGATTLDWYEEATATLTATGMTTTPTGTGIFTRNGDTVTALIPTVSGTSNATTFTLTGIPTNFRPSADRNVLVRTQDNGGAIVVSNATINSSGVLTMFKDAGTTAFTASGTKSVQTIQIQYQI